MPRRSDRILGLDPGFARTGFAVLDVHGRNPSVIVYGCIETPSRDPYAERLLQLERRVAELLDRYHPTAAALEKLFFCKNVKTAIAVGQARGVLLLTLARRGLTPIELTPQEVKMAATGYGSAKKHQVQRMMQLVLRLPHPPKPDDAADALAIAITAAQYRRLTTHVAAVSPAGKKRRSTP
ncbi:MAG: crossover junction endodeoxyribonuclease RuvC [bacterium]